ncbi:hypothetical protein QM284_05245 [Stutzerimonas stutzeri]|uniref:hypothetical protein n=2 Tax=Stutzerimonas stutzeri TaxID=316 RepID=UPI001C74F544|nr:hypothetical protein [Stutzerimonas stutzeri]MDI9727364.1 hypothetical protein [Stutzerimonas stutzeri]MDI9749914.1 hypothetical protein [Stutzerimonas stutzeri]BCY03883.1 hypothetical protein PszF2a_36720 [Stutzerimonas stutzeri]
MFGSLPRAALGAVLSFCVAATALAAPPGPGPGMQRGPGGPGPYPAPGPRHGHGLPAGAREVWIGSMLYFVAAGTYYLWNAERNVYEPVSQPPLPASEATRYDVIAYPAKGQGAEQQSRDRYECHSWAVSQSGFDPASARTAPAASVADTYKRALGACLTGRGYSVN